MLILSYFSGLPLPFIIAAYILIGISWATLYLHYKLGKAAKAYEANYAELAKNNGESHYKAKEISVCQGHSTFLFEYSLFKWKVAIEAACWPLSMLMQLLLPLLRRMYRLVRYIFTFIKKALDLIYESFVKILNAISDFLVVIFKKVYKLFRRIYLLWVSIYRRLAIISSKIIERENKEALADAKFLNKKSNTEEL